MTLVDPDADPVVLAHDLDFRGASHVETRTEATLESHAQGVVSEPRGREGLKDTTGTGSTSGTRKPCPACSSSINTACALCFLNCLIEAVGIERGMKASGKVAGGRQGGALGAREAPLRPDLAVIGSAFLVGKQCQVLRA